MKRQTRVLLDVDGVIADFESYFLQCAACALGSPVARMAVVDAAAWEMKDRYGLSDEERWHVDKFLFTQPAVDMPLHEGAKEFVQWALNVYDVYFVTSPLARHQTWCSDRRLWFEQRFGSKAAKRLVFTGCKHIIDGDVLVDDKLENVTGWLAGRSGAALPVWWHPRDRGTTFGLYKGCLLMQSWSELMDAIQDFERDLLAVSNVK